MGAVFFSYSTFSTGLVRRISLSTARYKRRFSQQRQRLVCEVLKFLFLIRNAL